MNALMNYHSLSTILENWCYAKVVIHNVWKESRAVGGNNRWFWWAPIAAPTTKEYEMGASAKGWKMKLGLFVG
jgi:hypothetical protein